MCQVLKNAASHFGAEARDRKAECNIGRVNPGQTSIGCGGSEAAPQQIQPFRQLADERSAAETMCLKKATRGIQALKMCLNMQHAVSRPAVGVPAPEAFMSIFSAPGFHFEQ